MKNKLTTILFLFSLTLTAQKIDLASISNKLINLNEVTAANEDFSGFEALEKQLEGVEIVMLGEQSHGEATTFETKIKLVKYLHQELGFDMLVFENGLYECEKAWELIQQGADVRFTLGKSIHGVWSTTEEFVPLVDYIADKVDSKNPLAISGFDQQIIKLGGEYFVKDLTDYLTENNIGLVYKAELNHLSHSIQLITEGAFKKYKKKAAEKDILFLEKLITKITSLNLANEDASFWVQVLKGTKFFLSDLKLKTDFRDEKMAENLIWLKEQHPDKKMICWGATSHFLYNSLEVRMDKLAIRLLGGNYYKKQPMMGHYIKDKYKDKVYTIGFTAYEGHYGAFSHRKLKTPVDNSLEFMLGQSKYDNSFLPLKNLTVAPYLSRPLGNFYMQTDISLVMDAVVFNRHMRRPQQDWRFFSKVYPENKYIAKFLDKQGE